MREPVNASFLRRINSSLILCRLLLKLHVARNTESGGVIPFTFLQTALIELKHVKSIEQHYCL